MYRYPLRKGVGPLIRGVTLLELVVAMSIMTLIAAAVGALARGVQMGSQYVDSRTATAQHARVTLERIERAANDATASEQFPGFAVFTEVVGGWRFPDTLVVWRPAGAPANPTGLPRYGELVMFSPATLSPQQLLEITLPGDTRTAPALSDTAGWTALLTTFRTWPQRREIVLTDRLRVAKPTAAALDPGRGAVRFAADLRPSSTEWASFRAGTTAWNDLNWVQDIRGSRTGLSQNWLRAELQFTVSSGDGAEQAIPFFGSAAVYYELRQ